MIDVSSVVRKIRFKTKDNDEIKYSDYEILQQINECLEYLNNSFALKNSDFLERMTMCEPVHCGIFKLPSDFITMVSISDINKNPLHAVAVGSELNYDEYYVTDGKIVSKANGIVIVYRRRLEEVDSINDDIDLPDAFKTIIANGVSALLVGQDSASVMGTMEDQMSNIVTRRRYTNARMSMPFRC